MKQQPSGGRWSARLVAGMIGAAFIGLGAVLAVNPLPTTLNDFYLRGTQPTPPYIDGEPNPAMRELLEPAYCAACHGDYDQAQEPYARWQHSMMGQAFRDPVFRAGFSIAQQDAPGSGDTCLRCHAPSGWIQARNLPSDGSGLSVYDKEGVTCHSCHRMVDPVYKPGVSPLVDDGILVSLGLDAPDGLNSNSYVIDPKDRRRGPFDISPQTPHQWLESPFHLDSSMCASCHDTSNPAYARQPDGSYAPTGYDAPHPTGNKFDMFPEQRTYSEWSKSAFAQGQVDLGSNRFGGQVIVGQDVLPRTTYSSCQDCHMPTTTGTGCNPFVGGQERDNLPQHNFNGANSWVLNAVYNLYDINEHHMFPDLLADALARNVAMLQLASDLEVTQVGSQIVTRITNQTGHKLPTGYPEGRRMWLNVRFFDAADQLVAERGNYDVATATLTTDDTKVYKTEHGIDAAVATATGRTPGPSFHLALNNVVEFDNRIPPRGYSASEFESVQAQPVGYAYADGQYWDDTTFDVPEGAVRAEVRVFYQTSSREYMEFLRDEDSTIPFDRDTPWGQLAYQQWEMLGMSAPVEMDFAAINLNSCAADFNADGSLDPDDLGDYINCYFAVPPCDQADFNHDGSVDPDDLGDFINAYFAGC